MKRNWEYLILLLLLLPAMVKAVHLAIKDYDEHVLYDEIVADLVAPALSRVQGAKNCDVMTLEPQTINKMGKEVRVVYEHPIQGRFKILFNSTFNDGFRLQKIYNYKYDLQPETGHCTIEQVATSPDYEQLQDTLDARGSKSFQLMLPSLTCN
jgi:hypothetical protein